MQVQKVHWVVCFKQIFRYIRNTKWKLQQHNVIRKFFTPIKGGIFCENKETGSKWIKLELLQLTEYEGMFDQQKKLSFTEFKFLRILIVFFLEK